MKAARRAGEPRVIDTLRRGWVESPELRSGLRGTILFAFGGALGRLVVPVLVQQAIDHGLKAGAVDVGVVTRLAVIGAVMAVVSSVCQRTAVARLARTSEHALYGLRAKAFGHVHALSIDDQAGERRGALVARVTSDIEALSQFLSWGGIAYLLDGTLMLAVAIVMLVYNWVLALVAFAVSAPLFIVLRFIQRRLIAAYDASRASNADVLVAVSEVVMGAGVVRAHGIEQRMVERVGVQVERQRRLGMRASILGALLFPSGEVFAVLTIAAVVVVGIAQGTSAGLTTGRLVGFVFLAYRFLEPIAEFTEILDQTQTAVAGWRRVLSLLDIPIAIADPPDGRALPPGPPRISVRNLRYVYPARDGAGGGPPVAALDEVTFEIEPAMAVAVVGATGSGKTTLAKLLTRLADPTDGQVLVAGIDLREVSFASLRSRLVMVPQEPFLFDTSVAENVRFGRPAASVDDVFLAFCELGLDGWVDSLAEGLQTRVGERGEHLSAGERQLVALARAYVANPSCLILDEATSAVDAATEARLARAIESLSRGRTSVTIAHRLSTAARADRILVFDRGHLVESGDHDTLVALGGVYAGLHASWVDATSVADPGR
jgi:putative ABC transport system ATP-binding protein